MGKQTIQLSGINQPVFIVRAETGIIYENETRGYRVDPRQCEGYIVPCRIARSGLGKYAYTFDPAFWQREAKQINLESLTRDILRVFNDEGLLYADGISRIETLRLDGEAWAECTVKLWSDDVQAFVDAEAVLTWENSD